MRTTRIVSKLAASITIISFCCVTLSIPSAHAGYLIPPAPGPFVECVNCCGSYPVKPHKHKHKKHYKKIKHYKHYKYYRYIPCNAYYYACPMPVVMAPCVTAAGCYRIQTHEFVEFNTSPNAYGSGRYIDNTYDNYDPDMSTGDDDPTIYPGMNIDR
ncbi:hypothetical protein AQUSIP_09350 [Aquicella siphonis]|uniref:Secreted protein n=1 Tax=Aquicella siphonis TaxID=254247 RepID=A0A5E4PG83_9COXI|nr:hypothetical protein [Aquicella siphonis]VVC75645.1 hypothetical protein AQUSIP_09350 [Aquicella siphonis]